MHPIAYYTKKFNEAAELNYIYPENKYKGKGIVICGGGEKYYPCAFVSMWVLRKLGCKLPIELWYTAEEVDTTPHIHSRVLTNIEYVNAGEYPQPKPYRGFEIKPFSIIHSGFEEVLFIDADNLVNDDPSYLFEEVEYVEYGAIFWPDLMTGRIWIPPSTWDAAGIEETNRALHAFESGQLLINKKCCWKELQLTMHLNEYSEFWYKCVYGDKDTFKLAWHKCYAEYGFAPKSKWKRPCIIQHDMKGQPLFYHACQGKQQLIRGAIVKSVPQKINLLIKEAVNALKEEKMKLQKKRPIIRKTDIAIMGRMELERNAKVHAINIPLANNVTLTRVASGPYLYCRTNEVAMSKWLIELGMWEAWNTLFVMRHVKPGWVCVDVGAHVGYYSVIMAYLKAKVIAIEPSKESCDLLERSERDNGFNIKIFNCGAWNENTHLPLYMGGNSQINNLLNPNAKEKEEYKVIADVPVFTLDHLLKDEEKIDFIKIDVENSEYQVWQGMQDVIRRCSPRIFMEFEGKTRPYPKEWYDELESKYKLRIVDYSGNLQVVTKQQLQQTLEMTMLYLSTMD